MPIPAQEQFALRTIFNKYGDSSTGRRLATQKFREILKFWFGSAYTFNFYGNAVDVNGYITKQLLDVFNQYNGTPNFHLNPGQGTGPALAQIESRNLLNIVFLKDINPTYEYPYGYVEYRIAPYDTTDRHLFLPLGLQNLKYHGCKLNGTSINANSTETTDGGPVVKVTLVNQNQIVFSNNNITTARSNTSGLPVRQLTSRDFSAGTGKVSETTTVIPANNA
jgi:hypothetical protein